MQPKKHYLYSLLCLIIFLTTSHNTIAWQCPENLKQSLPTLEAGNLNLCDTLLSAKAVLVVNTASMCGFTPQFEGLEQLFQEFKNEGLLVLGVPTADFGGQEYSDSAKTAKVCHANFGVSFPVFHKACIFCDKPDPLLTLVTKASDTPPKWNFYKYVFDPKTGAALSFNSETTPEATALRKAIMALLLQP
ncbi:glutathione peroxidase [Zhongshania sp.]|uniref:glutathione peroxidase n=1 Tax=Zhongshania sp. TaxID=1971902 RepID=UPI00356A0733